MLEFTHFFLSSSYHWINWGITSWSTIHWSCEDLGRQMRTNHNWALLKLCYDLCFASNNNIGKSCLTSMKIRSWLIQQKGKGWKEPDSYLEVPGNCVLHEKFLLYFEHVLVLDWEPQVIFFIVQNVKQLIYWLHMGHIFFSVQVRILWSMPVYMLCFYFN